MQRRKLELAAEKFDSDERIRANVRIHKERLRELAHDKSSGQISEAQFEALKKELEANLLADAQISATADISVSNRSTLLGLAFTSLVVVGGAAFLYYKWGAYELVQQQASSRFSHSELASAQAMAESGDTRGLLLQLRNKLRNSPSNLEGWSLLASSAMNAQMFDIAIEAYDRLIDIESAPTAKAALYGLKSQALYFSGKGLNSEEVRAATSNAFQLDKNETNTLGLLAIASFEARDFSGAINYWARILEVFPEHPSKDSIRLGIESAQRAIEESRQTELVSQSPGTVEQNGQVSSVGGVSVALTISENVLQSLSGGEQVVVFAKAKEGPPMPLAVARHAPARLPDTIVLDDSLAMMPELTLSLFDVVDVTARITSGSVNREAGDYEVVVKGVAVGKTKATAVNIQISDADVILAN